MERPAIQDDRMDVANKPRGMKPSPSLMFDILVEEDSDKQLEKYTRGSLDIQRGSEDADVAAAPAVANGSGVALPAQVQGMSASDVLKELLGDLYVDPANLREVGVLGEGGFASVRKCMLKEAMINFEEAVAVKRLKEFTTSLDLKEFLLEANLLRKMRHPNIVRLRGVGAGSLVDMEAARRSIYLVEEYMEGGDLKNLLLEQVKDPFRPLYSKQDALRWALQLAEAMHYLHAICNPLVIHRDLKLDNLLLTSSKAKEANVKLADFGLHKRVKKLPGGALAPWTSDFKSHHFVGAADGDRSYYGGNAFASMHGGAAHAEAQSAAMSKLATANGVSQSDLAILAATGAHPSGAFDPKNDVSVHRKILALKALNAAEPPPTGPPAPSPPAAAVDANGAVAASGDGGTEGGDVIGGMGGGRGGGASGRGSGLGGAGGSIKFIEGTQRVGSLLYMAPEVLKGQPYNEKVDVFGYGIILYELLSASHIMVRVCIAAGPEEMGPYAHRVSEGFREPMPAWWPPAVKKLVADCWAQDPRARPAFAEVVQRLQQMQRDGVAEEMERSRPSGAYSPVCDCGCAIM